ncbi:tyrosine-type recombinase/integrase [Methanolobus zinderi]|uniref:Tyrosine-type recombinase/integrase n=1 Tax=Methanolobus zinderi TaxID=536044 RepID=A0A7D5E9D8_9EURY|nr:tyrosine-type recombinase/integrase [Methanolobus zinderi]QLC51119.1 tyrosine-type recombinase/integrase [Methanolobus zinderi]
MSLYNYDRSLAAAESKIEQATYSENNKKLIFRFESYLFAEGLSKARVIKYLSQLNMIAGWADFELDEASREDIEYIAGIVAKKDVKDWTKHGYLTAIKRFYRWLNGGEDPEITAWIKPKVKNPVKLPEEMLPEDDIMSMVESVDHPRDKALVSIFWDAGGRPGELGELDIKHIVFDQYGAVAVVDGKTGMRRIRLVFSTPYLAAWINIHPDKNNPNAPLWVGIGQRGRGKKLKYAAIRMIIKRAAKKAGIRKRTYCYLFRHSRSTDLAQYLTESQMKEHLGWKQDSKMPAVYVHLSGKQIDDAMLRIHGIVKKEDHKPELTTVICARCKHVNSTASKFCAQCGMTLSIDAAVEVEEKRSDIAMALMELVEKDPEVAEVLRKVME